MDTQARSAAGFSIEILARIAYVGARDGAYCRRIEATAQEKLGTFAALGRSRRCTCTEAPAQLACGKRRPVDVDSGHDSANYRIAESMRFQFRLDSTRAVALRSAPARETHGKAVVALILLFPQAIDRHDRLADRVTAHGKLGLQLTL